MNRAEMRQMVVDEFNALLGLVYALLALAIVIALVGIANTVSLSVVERTRELGLLRAVGMSRGHLRGMVRWEAALVAVYGTLLGLGGRAVPRLVARLRDQGVRDRDGPHGRPVRSAGGDRRDRRLVRVLAALLPARRAARLDMLDAVATT